MFQKKSAPRKVLPVDFQGSLKGDGTLFAAACFSVFALRAAGDVLRDGERWEKKRRKEKREEATLRVLVCLPFALRAAGDVLGDGERWEKKRMKGEKEEKAMLCVLVSLPYPAASSSIRRCYLCRKSCRCRHFCSTMVVLST